MMERAVTVISGSTFICSILLFQVIISRVVANFEGDALIALKNSLEDPNQILQSWDASLVTPCTWFHVTCNSENSVTRVDLGNALLAGQLVSQLGQLPNLQYFKDINSESRTNSCGIAFAKVHLQTRCCLNQQDGSKISVVI